MLLSAGTTERWYLSQQTTGRSYCAEVTTADNGEYDYTDAYVYVYASDHVTELSYDDDAAKIVAVLIGAGILVLAVVSDAPTGLARTLPAASHVVIDYVLGLLLVVLPFVFGFAGDDNAATAFFIALGVAYVVLAVLTRYREGPARA
jgi:hypothetical protein